MRKIPALFLCLALFCGCAAKSGFLKDDFSYGSAYIGDISMRSLTITDTRKDASDRLLNPEFFAKSGTSDRVSPVLTQEQKELIGSEILKYTGKNGRLYDITVYVEKGEKAVRSAWPSKYETVNVSLKIRLTDGKDEKAGSGDMTLEVKSLKATDEYLEEMYQKALRQCVHECFAALKS